MRRLSSSQFSPWEGDITFEAEDAVLNGSLQLPADATGLVRATLVTLAKRIDSRGALDKELATLFVAGSQDAMLRESV